MNRVHVIARRVLGVNVVAFHKSADAATEAASTSSETTISSSVQTSTSETSTVVASTAPTTGTFLFIFGVRVDSLFSSVLVAFNLFFLQFLDTSF